MLLEEDLLNAANEVDTADDVATVSPATDRSANDRRFLDADAALMDVAEAT